MARSTSDLDRLRGLRAKAAGKDHEKLIEQQLQIAEHLEQIVFWQHAEPSFRMVGGTMNPRTKRWEPRFMPCGAGFADFSLVFFGGLAGALECKSTKEPRFPRSKISEDQIKHLDAIDRSGGLALFAMRFYSMDSGERVDALMRWRDVPWRVLRSSPSIGPDDVRAFTMARPRALEPFIAACSSCRVVMVRPAISPCPRCLASLPA